MINLTKEDWTEIYYALQFKAARLQNGDMGDDEGAGQDVKEWGRHLDSIIDKIGPDGEDAWAELGSAERYLDKFQQF